MTREDLAVGLGLIETVTGQRPTKALAAAWWELAQGVEADAWRAAIRRYLGGLTAKPRDFPMPGEVLQLAVDPTKQPISVEADDAWERLLRCNDYTPQSGGYWSPRRVRAELGDAVHRAVLEAGGYVQLQRLGEPQDEFWMRKRFVEAYGALRADGFPALEAGAVPSPRFALPERTGEPAIPVRAEGLERALPAGRPGPKAMPRPATVIVEATDERKRRLIEALGLEASA